MNNGKHNAKHERRRSPFGKRSMALVLSLSLLLGGIIGGTVAWLTANTEEVTNTFTPSDIDITLEETKTDFKMVPGWTIDKDPVVTVLKGSEDCWVFVKVEESSNLDDYIDYTVDPANWAPLDGFANVYFAKVTGITKDRALKVLLNDQVQVKDTVTEQMMEAAKDSQPTLTFTAYAVQLYKSNGVEFKPAEAWATINNLSASPAG